MRYFFLLIISFLVGSIPFGYVVCRVFKKIDIRKIGSGNIGATNVYRAAGGFFASIVLLLDILKGFFPVYLARNVFNFNSLLSITIGLSAILGHIFSIFMKGKGGKGVATSFGVIIGLFPLAAFSSFIIWLISVISTHIVSVSSIAGSIFLPLFIYLFYKDITLTVFGMVISLFILYTHRENIKRLLKKRENRIKLPWEKK